MVRVSWSEKALCDLDFIHDYIAVDSRFYARVQVERIVKAVEQLHAFPESGRKLPEFPLLPYREVIIGAYRCIYRYEPENAVVYMVTVVHGSRLLETVMVAENDGIV